MLRRDFLKAGGVAALSATIRAVAQDADLSAASKFILSAPLTHSDWMLKTGIAWGDEGVHHMLDACKECGWSRVLWRALDGGRSLYQSKLLRPMGKWDEDSFWTPQNAADNALARRFTSQVPDAQRETLVRKFAAMDYSTFDPLAEAVRYGHRIGLQIHAWVPINEDDHGWGLQSQFSQQHPEFRWRRRDRRAYHSQLSFAFPEVRRYKLAIIEELLQNYDIDGLFLDWIRTGDVRDNPQNDTGGVADYGYEQPLLARWRKQSSDDGTLPPNGDEPWARLRAEPQTKFMREVRKLTRERKRGLPVNALVGHPWHYRGEQDPIAGNLRGLLLDVAAWAQEGLVDAVVPAGYYRAGGTAELAWRAVHDETEARVDVWTYAWVPSNLAQLEETFALADKVSAKQILFWEADYIADRGNAAELKRLMARRALSTPV